MTAMQQLKKASLDICFTLLQSQLRHPRVTMFSRKRRLEAVDRPDRPHPHSRILRRKMHANDENDAKPVLDCLIIGGGPAGLSVATAMSRQLYQVVVFDSGKYRNDAASHMHNVATWDHRRPAEYREAARRNILERYNTAHIENTEIESVERTPAGQFVARDTKGTTWVGKKLVLATGSHEVFPDIPGYAECWATGM